MISISLLAIWLAAVEQTPSDRRPWIGGSNTNNTTELTFGYNGLGRLTGLKSMGTVNPRGYEGVVGADAGFLRLFNPNFAGELSWFLPPAILGSGLIIHRLLTGRVAASTRPLAKLMVVWFLSAFVVVSFMTGNVHPYYTLMIAPPMCYLCSVAIQYLAQGVVERSGRQLAGLTILATAFMKWVILSRYQDLGPFPSSIVIVSAILAAVILVFGPRIRKFGMYTAVLSTATFLSIPIIFNYVSLTTPQQGSFPQAGPVPTTDTWHRRNAEQLRLDQRETYALSRGEPVVQEVAKMIRDVPDAVSWTAMTVGSENAALYQLHTGRAVIAIGGFSGSDQFPLESAIKKIIRNVTAGYYIHQPGILKWGPSSDNTRTVVHWILDNCQRTTVEHLDVYDLRLCN